MACLICSTLNYHAPSLLLLIISLPKARKTPWHANLMLLTYFFLNVPTEDNICITAFLLMYIMKNDAAYAHIQVPAIFIVSISFFEGLSFEHMFSLV
uniref:Predicted protein n=1 Tax=Hordeum vulgare subsp. vulgare TaxID=112509 RepID=F2EGV7_HORVV|nr:predicted protein [Hordeum vulgare subsp. vulgare]